MLGFNFLFKKGKDAPTGKHSKTIADHVINVAVPVINQHALKYFCKQSDEKGE